MADQLNNSSPAGQVRYPKSVVRLNDTEVPALDWEVNSNNYYRADTFRVTLALSSMPPVMDMVWFAAQTSIKVEVFDGILYSATEPVLMEKLTQRILGLSDEVDIDPINNIVVISGRDLTSQLIDTKTTEKYVNNTAFDVVKAIAAKHGMSYFVVPTSKPKKVGAYYSQDFVQINKDYSEWDLLVYLAKHTRTDDNRPYNVWVDGMTIHFEPAPDLTGVPYVIEWKPPTKDYPFPLCNATNLKYWRNHNLSKDVVVTVKSFNVATGATITVSARASHKSKSIVPGIAPAIQSKVQEYIIKKPGLTPEQATNLANSKLLELSGHEMKLTCSLPGDSILDPRMPLMLKGTGTVFDQMYHVDMVVRKFNVHSGFEMDVHAKNRPDKQEDLS